MNNKYSQYLWVQKGKALFTRESGTTLSKPLQSWWVKMVFGTHSMLENMNYVSVKQ